MSATISATAMEIIREIRSDPIVGLADALEAIRRVIQMQRIRVCARVAGRDSRSLERPAGERFEFGSSFCVTRREEEA
jgi:hypothetical protein